LVGKNTGSIEGSYATGQVSATQNAGGLVGLNDTNGVITSSFATGAVTAADYAGGFVGSNEGLIKTSYATGTATTTSGRFVGGFLGKGDGTLSDNYWDTSTSLVSTGRGGSTQEGVTGLTTAQMKVDSNFSQAFQADWNFSGNYPSIPLFLYVQAASGFVGSSIYGDEPSFAYQIVSSSGSVMSSSGLIVNGLSFKTAAGDIFSGGQSVGDYSINYASGLSLAGYRMKAYKQPTVWTVTARPVTVVADAKSVVYGEADPSLSYAAESSGAGRGLVNGDALGGELSRNAGTDVGNYAINQGTLANSNYAITYTGADLGITARPVTVVADAKSVVYGEADPALSYVAESSGAGRGLVNGDALSGELSRNAGTDVGNYAINQGTLANSNYAITYTGADLGITARPVMVVADSLERAFAADNPNLTYTVAVSGTSMGLVSSESLRGILVTSADKQSPPGVVSISQGTLTNAQNGNYDITFVDGVLTVDPRPFFESVQSAVVLPVIPVITVIAPVPTVALSLQASMPSAPPAATPVTNDQGSPAAAFRSAASPAASAPESTSPSAEGSANSLKNSLTNAAENASDGKSDEAKEKDKEEKNDQ
jgi:hypothetical protein